MMALFTTMFPVKLVLFIAMVLTLITLKYAFITNTWPTTKKFLAKLLFISTLCIIITYLICKNLTY